MTSHRPMCKEGIELACDNYKECERLGCYLTRTKRFVFDVDVGPDGDLWTPSGPATTQQKKKALQQRREAINLIRAFLESAASSIEPDLYGKARAFIFDAEHT